MVVGLKMHCAALQRENRQKEKKHLNFYSVCFHSGSDLVSLSFSIKDAAVSIL